MSSSSEPQMAGRAFANKIQDGMDNMVFFTSGRHLVFLVLGIWCWGRPEGICCTAGCSVDLVGIRHRVDFQKSKFWLQKISHVICPGQIVIWSVPAQLHLIHSQQCLNNSQLPRYSMTTIYTWTHIKTRKLMPKMLPTIAKPNFGWECKPCRSQHNPSGGLGLNEFRMESRIEHKSATHA